MTMDKNDKGTPTPAARTATMQRGRPFPRGTSGNPTGRKQGSRNKATLAAQALLDGEAEALTRKCVELAMGGDATALRLCLERLLPPRKDRPIKIKLPAMKTPADAVKVSTAILRSVGAGALTPTEGQVLAELVEAHRKLLETEDLAARIAALEARAENHNA